MSENYHSADCLMRRGSYDCTCGNKMSELDNLVGNGFAQMYYPEAATELKNMRDNEEWSSDKIVELAETIAQLRADNKQLREDKASCVFYIDNLKAQRDKLRAELDEAKIAIKVAFDMLGNIPITAPEVYRVGHVLAQLSKVLEAK